MIKFIDEDGFEVSIVLNFVSETGFRDDVFHVIMNNGNRYSTGDKKVMKKIQKALEVYNKLPESTPIFTSAIGFPFQMEEVDEMEIA